MKKVFVLFTFVLTLLMPFYAVSQEKSSRYSSYKKGNYYIYWGWNRESYSKSDIHFKGNDYDFTLHNVIARDRQSAFKPSLYFGFKTLTIPQYNLRIGYFVTDHYQISLGNDHMKYVMQNNLGSRPQRVAITGSIQNGTRYTGYYVNDSINLDSEFLLFEHTDGLNYENLECRRFDVVWSTKYIQLAFTEGLGAGVLIPRTNTTLMNHDRYDEFHLAGWSTGGVVALNITFLKHIFIQSEIKAGYINMPDIRTTSSESDRANQHFYYLQENIVMGFTWNFTRLKSETKANAN